MTMPHLQNCSHSPDGWCLECVSKLYEEAHQYDNVVAHLYKDREDGYVDLDDLSKFGLKIERHSDQFGTTYRITNIMHASTNNITPEK